MPRIPWDELSLRGNGKRREVVDFEPKEVELVPEVRDFKKDAADIGRRTLFGLVCGSITGATFGAVEVMRDTKSMTAKKSVATAKVARFAGLFGGFFASYHGVRKALVFYNPQPVESNVIIAASLCVAPLIVISTLRPLIPYSIMLIGLDAINGFDDV